MNPAILQITALLAADILRDKHQGIPLVYSHLLEALNNRTEKRMADADSRALYKQYTEGPRFLRGQRPGVGIRQVPHLPGGPQNLLPRLLPYVGIVIERLRYRSRRVTGSFGDIVNCSHSGPPPGFMKALFCSLPF
ncbi:hypothetical protein D3C73_1206810 [compost metagenome]